MIDIYIGIGFLISKLESESGRLTDGLCLYFTFSISFVEVSVILTQKSFVVFTRLIIVSVYFE